MKTKSWATYIYANVAIKRAKANEREKEMEHP